MYDTLIDLDTIDGITVATIGNEVDLANSETVRRYLDEAVGTRSTFVVSLERCRYIDSSGLRPIIALAARLGPGFSAVVVPGTRVHRIFEIAALHKKMNVCATLAEALEASSRSRAVA